MKYARKAIAQNPKKYEGDAVCCMVEYLDKTRPGRWKNLSLDHIDAAGYWYSYTDTVNDCRAVWCIRFNDVVSHCRAVHA